MILSIWKSKNNFTALDYSLSPSTRINDGSGMGRGGMIQLYSTLFLNTMIWPGQVTMLLHFYTVMDIKITPKQILGLIPIIVN
jgi:hypothetical protein